MNRLIVSCALLTSALTCTVAHGQSLKQRELIASDKVQVAEHLAAANKTCGSSVKIVTDYSTFADVTTSPDNPNQQNPWAFIVNVTDAMDAMCRSNPEAKAAIASKLHLVNVKHASAESFSYSAGTLNYAVPYSNPGYHKLMDYLGAQL